jgi:hypothetical protein
VRQTLILLVEMVAVFLLAGCARDGGAPQSQRTQAEEAQIASTARIVCIRDNDDVKEGDTPNYSTTKESEAHNKGTLTRVLTPKIAAQPDGVHFVVDNQLGAEASFSVEYPSGAVLGGMNAPKGENRGIEPFPPGKIKIVCEPPRYEAAHKLEYASMEILEGKSGYRTTELECSGGGLVQSGGGLYAAGEVEGKKGDPVDMTKRRFSDQIKEGDVVEVAGYPRVAHSQILGNSRYVRVLREGKVVAVMQYLRHGGGWLEGEYSACQSF